MAAKTKFRWILDFLAANGSGVAVGFVAAWVVVWAFFSDARVDAYAVAIVTFLATGLFSTAVVLLLCRRRVNTAVTIWGVAVMPWLILACWETWRTAKEEFIKWSYLRWMLTSGDWQTDTRVYALNWIIRGWIAILVAAALALIVSRLLASRIGTNSAISATQNSLTAKS